MADLIAGRYPIFEEEWALDGNPLPPYRRSMSRRDIVANGTLTQAVMYVVAIVCQPGDIIGAVNIAVQTATSVGTHGWAALYTGVGSTATLITQSADNTSGFVGTGAAQKFTLATPYLVGGNPGTTQGAANTGGVSGQSVILGVALYNSGTTGGKLDGMTGGSIAGQIVATGQVAIMSSGTLAATATAPSALSGTGGYAAIAGFVPYVALSRT